MLSLTCDICQEDYDVDKFLFEPACGHGICSDCFEATKTRHNCVLCRKPKDKNLLAHRVFLTSADSSIKEQAESLTSSLSALDSNSSPSQFKGVAAKMKTIADKMDGESAALIVASAKNMDERLRYFAYELQTERDEKVALRRKVDLWHEKIIASIKAERELECLKAVVRESKEDISKLETKNNDLARELDALKYAREKQDDLMQKYQASIADKDRELEQLREERDNAEKQRQLQKRKMKALAKAARHAPPPDTDDSLLVDQTNTFTL